MSDKSTRTRRPIEAIESRTRRSAECERKVLTALTKLARTGAPFTVENVCDLAGVGKTFIYDKRRPELTQAVLTARDASQAPVDELGADPDGDTRSWKERAINAEALAKSLRAKIREQDSRISDLAGELFDPQGHHLAEQNSELRSLVQTLSLRLRDSEIETARLRRSLDAARANVKRERERGVSQIVDLESASHARLSVLRSSAATVDTEMK